MALEQVYSRGLGPYFVTGTNHQASCADVRRAIAALLMGRVSASGGERESWWSLRRVHDLAPLKPGDGLVFDAADWRSPQEPEEGGRVYESVRRPRRKNRAAIRQSRRSVRPYPSRRSGVANRRS